MLFNETSENCSTDEYVEVDNAWETSEEVDVRKIDWQEKLLNECIKEVLNSETANSDLEDEDEGESQESSSSSIIALKGALLSLHDKVHLFATYNELIIFLVNVYYDPTFRELKVFLFWI